MTVVSPKPDRELHWSTLVVWSLIAAVAMMALVVLLVTMMDAYKAKRLKDCEIRGVDRVTCERVIR